MPFQYETDLEKAATPFLDRILYKYDWQVPLYNRVIDLVGLDFDMNIIGVEFKLRNWRKALEQLQSNSNSLDYMYICIPKVNFIEKIKKEASYIGAGVLVYDYNLNTIIIEQKSRKRGSKWEPNIEYIKDYIKKGGKNGNK